MTAITIAAEKNANRRVDASSRASGEKHPLYGAIARVARSIWPTKTDLELAVRTGTSDRVCRDLLAGRGGLSAPALANLIRSEEGLEFLGAVLGDASPEWRKRLAAHVDIAVTRFELEEQRRRLSKLEQEVGAEFSAKPSPLRLLSPLPKRR